MQSYLKKLWVSGQQVPTKSEYVGEYHRDLTFKGYATFVSADGNVEKSSYIDTWYIKESHLYIVAAKDYGSPEMNQTAIDEIESITAQKMILISPGGKRLIRYRME